MEDTAPPSDGSTYARMLLDSGVVKFGSFVAKSGRLTPYFIDAGRFATGNHLSAVGDAFASAVDRHFADGVDVLFGPAYKGIPLVVATGIALARDHGRDVGVAFDRKEAKDHGEGGVVIGHRPRDGDRVVIIEDVTTAGTSVRASAELLRASARVELVGLVVGVDRRERGSDPSRSALDELGDELGVKTVALTTIDEVLDSLPPQAIDDETRTRIAEYRREHGVVSAPG